MSNILEGKVDEQLRELVVGLLMGLGEQLRENEVSRIRQGMRVDVESLEWNLATEVGN